jgi:uncharacterized cupin superfamily protein
LPGANVFEPKFDAGSERPGFSMRRARLGRQAGAERLGASLYELPPGQAPWPYHAHLGNEEMLVVVRGRPHLRTPEGWRQLAEGELVSFPVGEEGSHQLHNRTDEPVRILLISEMNAPDIAIYPDSAKFGLFGRPPGSPEGGMKLYLRRDGGAEYWHGEDPPGGGAGSRPAAS